MKPSRIYEILDLARRARQQGNKFNPMFVGAPGLGMSEIVQSWCKNNNLPFIDLRLAFLEAPDMIGYPSIKDVTSVGGVTRSRTVHNLPEFWPTEGEGVLLLEEPNRGSPSMMNTCMQLLTDRKVHNYTLPEGWIIVGCINPEDEHHDVNTMDTALKDRFEFFCIEYNESDFVRFMKKNKWDQSIISFVQTHTWSYLKPEEVAKNEGAKYLSPRTFSKLNTAIAAGFDDNIEKIIYDSVLGTNIGRTFYTFKYNEQPVSAAEILDGKTREIALEKIRKFSDPKSYKAATISITMGDIVNTDKLDDDLLVRVILATSADAAYGLVCDLDHKRSNKKQELLLDLCSKYPEVKKYFRNQMK